MTFGFTAILLLISLLFFNCGGPEEDTENDETVNDETTYDATTSETCYCESSWFNGSEILPPPEGPNSPFADTSTTNCLFHQWSWQKFLYITQVPDGQTLPYFLSEMNQVTSEMAPVTPVGATLALTESAQAGGGGILSSNETYGTYETVYYSIHIDDTFKNAAEGFEAWIRANPDSVNNKKSFPVGSLELKASWVKADAIPSDQHSNFYKTTATIGTSTTADSVLLLGLHVVGVVENHPEFIWATFEHNDLAAFYDWDATSNADVPVTSSTNLPFFNSEQTASLPDIQWTYGVTTPRNPNNVFTIYQYGTPRVPGGGFMTTTSQADGAENYNNIDMLNNSVHDTISNKGLNLWTNYFYNGSIWMNMDGKTHDQQIAAILDPARINDFGDVNSGGPLRGSVNAFNITMETYEQTKSKSSIHAMTVDSLMNCLDCHGPSSYLEIEGQTNAESPLYISHLFMNYMHTKDSTLTVEEIRAMRFKLFNQVRNK